MKKALPLSFVAFVLVACNSSAPPKEVAEEFIQAVQAADVVKASRLATEKTKVSVSEIKKHSPNKSAGEGFSFASLTETVNGNTAEVKNDAINLTLENEKGSWKVAATPEVIATIIERPEDLAQLKHKWEALLKEYNGRLNVAREYVQYKKGQGTLSAPMQNLEAMVNKLSAETQWNKEKMQQYSQNQLELEKLFNEAHEPTTNAHADLSLNYFLQLSDAADRIRAAQKEYNDAVAKMPSVMYPALAAK